MKSAQHRPWRHVATTEDVTRIWQLRHLGYTWLQIAAALGLSTHAITQARRRAMLARDEEARCAD